MIAAALQRSFADGFIAEEVKDLREPWMRHADQVLHDDQLLEIVQQALSKRCKKSKIYMGPTAAYDIRNVLHNHKSRLGDLEAIEYRITASSDAVAPCSE